MLLCHRYVIIIITAMYLRHLLRGTGRAIWCTPIAQDHVTRVRRKQPLYDNSPADNGRVTVTVQLYGYRVTLVPHPVVYYSQAPVVCGDSRVTIGKLQCKSCSIRIKVGQQSHFSQDNNQLPVTCYNSHKVTRNQSYNSQLTGSSRTTTTKQSCKIQL